VTRDDPTWWAPLHRVVRDGSITPSPPLPRTPASASARVAATAARAPARSARLARRSGSASSSRADARMQTARRGGRRRSIVAASANPASSPRATGSPLAGSYAPSRAAIPIAPAPTRSPIARNDVAARPREARPSSPRHIGGTRTAARARSGSQAWHQPPSARVAAAHGRHGLRFRAHVLARSPRNRRPRIALAAPRRAKASAATRTCTPTWSGRLCSRSDSRNPRTMQIGARRGGARNTGPVSLCAPSCAVPELRLERATVPSTIALGQFPATRWSALRSTSSSEIGIAALYIISTASEDR